MINEILIGILITILSVPVLWIIKKVYGPLKNAWRKLKVRRTVKRNRDSKSNPEVEKSFRQSNESYKLKAKIEDDSHQYNENYRKRYGTLEGSSVKMHKPVLLESVSVTVQSLYEKDMCNYQSSEGIEKMFQEEGKNYFGSSYAKDGISVANDEQYLMVLGDPGAGKSTFLRKVGFEASKGKDGNLEHEHIPVFLELKKFTKDSIDVKELIIQEFKICGYPDPKRKAMEALKAGNLLILLDGLDEIRSTDVENVIREIWNFVDQYRHNRFIASGRKIVNIGGFGMFTNVKMADFDDSQVEAYMKNWFTSTPTPHQFDEGMKTVKQCWEMLNAEEYQEIKELSHNPLLLAMLCMVYEDDLNFPRNRTNLYEKVLNIFLKKWMAKNPAHQDLLEYRYWDISIVKKMLFEIASRNFKDCRFLFCRDELINQMEKICEECANTQLTFEISKLLDTIVDHGIFVERIRDFYSFPHLTFQEYLTANFFIRETQSIQVLVTEHLHDKRWREVFLFAAKMMTEADSLLVEMEAEANKFINTPGLKALFNWAKCITNISDDLHSGVIKRAFAIRQYFSLRLLNKIYKEVTNFVNRGRNPDPDSIFDQDLKFYQDLTENYRLEDYRFNYNLYLDFDQVPNLSFYHEGSVDAGLLDVCGYSEEDLCLYLNQNLNSYRDLSFFLFLYGNLDIDLLPDPDFNFYQDLYRYTDADFYPLVYSKFGDGFDLELRKRITLVQLIEQARIFKGVDLQRLIRRFDEQQQFVKAASKGETVILPKESIHDTWISVLKITDDLLAIPYKEIENYVQYVHTIQLILACKDAAGRVSPKVWQKIEDQLLTWDIDKIKD